MSGDISLHGKTALVTGGGAGIGKAGCLRFGRGGARVVVADLDLSKAEEVALTLRNEGCQAIAVGCDVRDAKSVESMVDAVLSEFGRLDVFFHNAMNVQLVNNRDARCPDLEDEVWQEIIQLVLTGTFYCCKHVSRAMFRTKGGSIILTATVDALIGQAGLDAYSAAKGGVIAMTRSLAAGVAADGIRVNAICPGFVRTEAQRYWMDDAIAFQSIRNMHLLEVPGPDEIASFAAFLASDLAKAMTGGIHPVDAGYLAFKGRETMNLIQQNKPKDISDSSMGRTP